MSKGHEAARSTGSRRTGRVLVTGLLFAGLVGLMPGVSQATPGFKIAVVNLSSPVAVAGQEYTLRSNVATTCTPFMAGGLGTCQPIELTITWWTDPSEVKVGERHVAMVGGPLQFSIPAADVQAPRLNYRIVASQVWTLKQCLLQTTCAKKQTAATQIFGSANVM